MHDFLARAGAYALAVQSFLAANPWLSVPLTGAIVTLLFKPRTPEQYAKIAKVSPRLATILLVLGALFPDLAKAHKIVGKTLTGKSLPPPPVVLALVLCVPMLSGCAFLQKHAKDVLNVAQIACILANQTASDSKVAEICGIADDFFEPMQNVLADARKASESAAQKAVEETRAIKCSPTSSR